MALTSSKKQSVDLFEVVELIARFRKGELNASVLEADESNPLKVVLAEVNALAEQLRTQTSAEAQARLTIAYAQLEEHFSTSLDLMCIANTNGLFKRVNPSFTRILGYSEEELLSQGFLSFIHPDDVSSTMNVVAGLAAGKLLLDFENRYRCKSGEYRTISWHCRPNTRTGDLYATGRDITEYRRAEASLRKDITEHITREQESRFILDGLGIGIWKWDLITNALEWDENMYRLYGADPKDFNGAYDAWERSLSPDTKAKAIEEINAAVRGEREFDTTFQVVHKSGKVQEIRTRAFVIRDGNGKPLRMHGINVDRSREAELEKNVDMERAKAVRNAKLASLGEMSAGIAHEINNPLTIIYGTVRTLPKFANNSEQLAAKIEIIQSASERIAKIVKSLRKFSRDSDKADYKLHSLFDIIKEAIVLTAAKARRHATKIEVIGQCNEQVFCDEIEIEQVLVNMINNAVDAVKNRPEKSVSLELLERDGHAVLRIRDSGPRISFEVQQKLFQPFFTTKPVGQGTGLGLSIVKGILDEHHAVIELLADEPQTCFEIRFPKAEVKRDAT